MLTEKEIEVLRLSQKGLNQIAIAKKLGVSQPAVSRFYRNVMRKIAESKEILDVVQTLEVIHEKL